MKHHFVFRLDGSKENDEFFGLRCSRGDIVAYSGTAMVVGPGWIPDLVEVHVSDDCSSITITLVELEAQASTARASCRKYLAEPSSEIVRQFNDYLQGVMKQCKATTDPRFEDVKELQASLAGATEVEVRTAGALRSAADYLESHALLDQPKRGSVTSPELPANGPTFSFSGVTTFSREAKDGLRRTVRVLHAVVAGHDYSDGTLNSWRNSRRKPLDLAVQESSHLYPNLNQLLQNKSAAGMRLDCDRVASELAALWSTSTTHPMTAANVIDTIRRFAPTCMRFSEQDSMRAVFESARAALTEDVT